MQFVEPTKRYLLALCGWALSRQRDAISSDEQSLALHRFKEGCSDLAEVVDDLPRKSREATPDIPFELTPPVSLKQGDMLQRRPADNDISDETCKHKFSIRTQLCVKCGRSYRQVMSAKPTYLGDPRYDR